MPLNYININDVKNVTFNKFTEPTRSGYIDEANEEIENLAQQLGVTPSGIHTPIHYVIERYSVNFALSRMAEDMISANESPILENDIYADLFKRTHYIMNELRPQINKQVLTGEITSREDRSISWGRSYRG